MSMEPIEDEFEAKELEYDNVLAGLNSIESLERSVLQSKTIDRMTMESLHRLSPESVDKNYPLSTFTTDASAQNYEVALESFSVAKAVAIAAIGGILGAILYQLINAFRSNKVDVRTEYLDKKKDSLKDGDRSLKKSLDRVKKMTLSTEDQLTVDAISAWNVEFFLGKPTKSSKTAEDFISAVKRGGQVYRIMDRWSSDIVKHTSEFKKRVRLMTEIVEVMYEVRGSDINELQAKAKSITLDSSDKFMADMNELDIFFRSLGVDEGFSSFINEQVDDTQEFREVVGNMDVLMAYDKLYSNSSVQIEKNLKEIEDKYAPVLQGSASDKALKKAKAAARAKSSSDEVGVSQDAAVLGMINPFLMRAIEDAEKSLRLESVRLRSYIMNLERVLFFYQKAVTSREKIEQQAMLKLTDIENRNQ